ncbi:hypothetical protein WMY93_011378 [Mugilogobius chulae]
MLIRQSLRNKLKALRSFRKGERLLYSRYGERQAIIKKQRSRCESNITLAFQAFHSYLQCEEEKMLKCVEEEANRLTWAASQKRDTLHSSVLSCDKAIESVTEQIVEGWQLNDSALHISPPEQLVCPDLFLNEAHYLGNLRYRVWNDLGKITVFTSIILDPNTAATCVKVSPDLLSVSYLRNSSSEPLPQRIEWAPGVLASRAINPHDTLRFAVDVGDHEKFEIGFISAKASRKGPRPNSAQLFLLSRHGSHFLWNGDKKSAFVPREKADCITILYDGLRKMLSFTDRKSGFQLHVCSTKHITDQLFPFLAADESLKSQTKRIRLVTD